MRSMAGSPKKKELCHLRALPVVRSSNNYFVLRSISYIWNHCTDHTHASNLQLEILAFPTLLFSNQKGLNASWTLHCLHLALKRGKKRNASGGSLSVLTTCLILACTFTFLAGAPTNFVSQRILYENKHSMKYSPSLFLSSSPLSLFRSLLYPSWILPIGLGLGKSGVLENDRALWSFHFSWDVRDQCLGQHCFTWHRDIMFAPTWWHVVGRRNTTNRLFACPWKFPHLYLACL